MRLIQHLHVSPQNYQAAWSLLKQRYNNKRILFKIQWDRVLDQPRQLLDTTNEYLNAIESQGISTEEADQFIARTIVRKLDKKRCKII